MSRRKTGAATPADDRMILVLEENLEIADAAELHVKLQSLQGNKGGAVLDGSQVKSVDTAILQLLVVLIRQARADGMTVTWQEPSEILCNTSALLGLDRHLCLVAE